MAWLNGGMFACDLSSECVCHTRLDRVFAPTQKTSGKEFPDPRTNAGTLIQLERSCYITEGGPTRKCGGYLCDVMSVRSKDLPQDKEGKKGVGSAPASFMDRGNG